MELLLNKVCGQPAALPVVVRRCGPADAAAFFALQNEVRAAMPHPEQFVPDTQENITAYLAHDLCLGVFDGERLGAYFILRYCGQSEHNYAAFLGVPKSVYQRSAFVRQSGLGLTPDDALEARLSALVTTGDEAVSFAAADKRLLAWQNRVRHNKTGLIPDAERELAP